MSLSNIALERRDKEAKAQKDRLNHEGLNVGLSWKTKLGNGNSSNVTTTLGYNEDDFNTYGPSSQFYRTGTLDTKLLTARVEHEWQITSLCWYWL